MCASFAVGFCVDMSYSTSCHSCKLSWPMRATINVVALFYVIDGSSTLFLSPLTFMTISNLVCQRETKFAPH